MSNSDNKVVRLTAISGNSKTGPIPVSTTIESSCPSICPLRKSGCYADVGPIAWQWSKVATVGNTWSEFCDKIARLRTGTFWRHNQAGDLLHNEQVIDKVALADLVTANKGKRGFTYTHHDVQIASNRTAVAKANAYGFTVNLSANNLVHADELIALGIAPVVSVVAIEHPKLSYTPNGHKVIVCPATYREDVTCQSCELCQKVDRRVIVAFPVHGVTKKKAQVNALNFVSKTTLQASYVSRETLSA